MTSAIKLKEEIDKIKDISDIFTLSKFDTNIDGTFTVNGKLNGPSESPYNFGEFPIQIIFFPNDSPSFNFLSPIPFHPNIDAITGKVLIKSPTQSVESIIRSVHSLLTDIDESNIVNNDAGNLFKDNKNAFKIKVIETMKQNGQYYPPDPLVNDVNMAFKSVVLNELKTSNSDLTFPAETGQSAGTLYQKKFIKYVEKLAKL